MKKTKHNTNDNLLKNEIDNVNIAKPIDKIAEEIKTKLGLKEVFITTIAEQDIIWRKLKRSEDKEIMTNEYNENKNVGYYQTE